MTPEVNEIHCKGLFHGKIRPIGEAKGDACFLQKLERLGVQPAFVPDLQGSAKLLDYALPPKIAKEAFEALDVEGPGRGKLKENGAQLLPKARGPLKEEADGGLGVLQPLDVGDEAAGFDGEDEAQGRALPPSLEGRSRGEAVEGVVQLNRLKMPAVVPKPLGGSKALRVEDPPPMGVAEAARSNEGLPCHEQLHPAEEQPQKDDEKADGEVDDREER